jgi:flavin prenyltransferase
MADVETHLVVSSAAGRSIFAETARTEDDVIALADRTYHDNNQAARISSGSFPTIGMVVVACSETTLASIAIGYADTLLHRAADVTMKEGRPLTIVGSGLRSSSVGADAVTTLGNVPRVEIHDFGEGSDEEIDATIAGLLDRYGVTTVAAVGRP